MTEKDYSTIQRQLGFIEGIALKLQGSEIDFLIDAIAVIDEILDKEICNDSKDT